MQYETPLWPMHFVQTSIDVPGDGLVERHLCTELGTAWSLPGALLLSAGDREGHSGTFSSWMDVLKEQH